MVDTTMGRPPKQVFRMDMLWNDSRYRSTFLQIVALFIVLLALLYLLNNVRVNLAEQGKTFGFSFMSTPSSYDINQQPIDYTSRDSHARASVIGMLNTLIVAVVGCFLATVIGVLAGVARLSKNWIVRGLMSVYIEGVRNIPVLIQILLIAAVINETLPQPSAFRGENATASMILWDSVAVTGRGVYIPRPLWGDGSAWVVAALILAIVAAIVFGRWAQARQQKTGEILPTFPIQAAMIILTPVLVFFIAGMPIGLENPALKGFNFQGGIHMRDSYVALTLALSIYTGAFIAENVRAGIQAVSHGQTEAAYALGLQPGRTMSLVVLPQALRIIIPPLISQYLNLTKNSSLALLVGYMDATGTLMGITLNQTGKEFETLFLGMGFYLSISLSIAAVMNLYNQNSQLVERTSVVGGGFSFLNFFGGNWEILKKGDAKMRSGYGIRGVLNLYVLFYLAVLVLLLHYVFILRADEARPSYWGWSYPMQFAVMGMIIMSFGALITCLFKNARFIDMAVLEFILFVIAVLIGFPFATLAAGADSIFLTAVLWISFPLGSLVPDAGPALLIAGGAAARLLIIGYTIYGARPNLTFFNRERRA